MRRILILLTCCFVVTAAARADEPLGPDGTPIKDYRGLFIMRQGNATAISVGGNLLPRLLKVTTQTPEGPVVTRFKLPSDLHGPGVPPPAPLPGSIPAYVRVDVPDTNATVYVEGELVRTRGTSRQLESPPLAPGKDRPLHVRVAYAVGDKLLIEDKDIVIRAGESSALTFDGSHALAVPLPSGALTAVSDAAAQRPAQTLRRRVAQPRPPS